MRSRPIGTGAANCKETFYNGVLSHFFSLEVFVAGMLDSWMWITGKTTRPDKEANLPCLLLKLGFCVYKWASVGVGA
jgi:hypothetical protein